MKLQLCNEKQSLNTSPTWHQNCSLSSLPLGQTPECWDPLRIYTQVEIQEKFQQNFSSLPGHTNIWIELPDLILAIQLQKLMCRFNLAIVFQRLITKGSPLLLTSEVITYYPDSLIYFVDTYWSQAVCPNYFEMLIQHLTSFKLKYNSDRIQIQRPLCTGSNHLPLQHGNRCGDHFHSSSSASIQVEYRPKSCRPCQLWLFHHSVAARGTRIPFTVILIWIVSAVIVFITQKPILYAPACNQNQERQKDTVYLTPNFLSFWSYQTSFKVREEWSHIIFGFFCIHTWKHEGQEAHFLLFAYKGTQKPSPGHGRITCTALKIVATVLLGVFASLGGYTLPSVSHGVHALSPIKLSKDLNAPWTKLHRNSWKCWRF